MRPTNINVLTASNRQYIYQPLIICFPQKNYDARVIADENLIRLTARTISFPLRNKFIATRNELFAEDFQMLAHV